MPNGLCAVSGPHGRAATPLAAGFVDLTRRRSGAISTSVEVPSLSSENPRPGKPTAVDPLFTQRADRCVRLTLYIYSPFN